MPSAAIALADEFDSLRRAIQAQAEAARGCLRAVLDSMLLFLLARQLRRLERLLRAIPSHPAALVAAHADAADASVAPLARHGRAFIPRRRRIGSLPTWFAANRGARAILSHAAPAARPHFARAPPPYAHARPSHPPISRHPTSSGVAGSRP